MVIANILPLYGVYGEASAVLGQPPCLRELNIPAVEQPLDGLCIRVAGHDHSILMLGACAVAD